MAIRCCRGQAASRWDRARAVSAQATAHMVELTWPGRHTASKRCEDAQPVEAMITQGDARRRSTWSATDRYSLSPALQRHARSPPP